MAKTERELHELRVREWSDLSLAALAIALSLVATEVAPTWVLPLFLGGLGVAVLGARAFFRRWDLCEQLAVDPDAYVIREVSRRADAVAGAASRAALAQAIKVMLAPSPSFRHARVTLVADELAVLETELRDNDLSLDPLCAVRCKRLLTDTVESPLLNSQVPADGLRVAIVLIRRGFAPR